MVSLSIIVINGVVCECRWIHVSQSVFQIPPQTKLSISLLSIELERPLQICLFSFGLWINVFNVDEFCGHCCKTFL